MDTPWAIAHAAQGHLLRAVTMAIWNDPRGLVRHASMGVEFTVTFLAPLMLGYWLDSREGTTPGFMLLGGTIGFAFGLWRLIRQARRIQRENQPPPGEEGPPPTG